jgi:hypothetical protein
MAGGDRGHSSWRTVSGEHDMSYKLTYSTMFNPPESMHQQFDAALANPGTVTLPPA